MKRRAFLGSAAVETTVVLAGRHSLGGKEIIAFTNISTSWKDE